MSYKSPGVYVKEISLFPPSVAAVETAIPAFIGYTEKALDKQNKDLTNQPVKISSLLAFAELFGGDYVPDSYEITVDTTNHNAIDSVQADKRFYLYNSLKVYFDNGGGDCYIVSVGSYQNPIEYENRTNPAQPVGLKIGLDKLFQFDEPTLILFPDAVALMDGDDPDYVSFGNLQKAALEQSGKLMDRFVIMDIMEGFEEDAIQTQIDQFRANVGTQHLKYGAAYHPWINTTYQVSVRFNQLNFINPDESDITDLSGFSDGDAELQAMVTNLEAVYADIEGLIDIMQTNTDMVLKRGLNSTEDYLRSLKKGIISNNALMTNFTHYMNTLANMALVLVRLDTNVEAELQANLDDLKADTDLIDAIINLVAIEKHADITPLVLGSRIAAASIYADLNSTDWLGGDDFDDVTANTSPITGTNLQRAFVDLLSETENKLMEAFLNLFDKALHYQTIAESIAFESHPFFRGVIDRITKDKRLLPPSGAIAGVYCTVDSTRGVWKAPANISLSSVLSTAIKVTDADQSALNVHTTGKSINCIRAFTGRGILVWGARTLAGNDNEWRYVNVRRFFNMVEESVKKSTEHFVFEPNDANTWVKVRAMIENFLLLQWRQGALAGAKPDQAFFVKVGLGETMTSLDILEGKMVVEIGMAAVRPAEFIILKFSHKMQE